MVSPPAPDRVRILGIETSCDETAAAVVEDGRIVLSSVVSSQVDRHARYGGVVPEVASRAHVELIGSVVADALGEAGVDLGELDAVAACHGPGLAGALLVGVSAAKALALVAGRPYVGVNHLEAHLLSAWLEEPDLAPPLAVLIVSGGHTLSVIVHGVGRYEVVGRTVDDAAGEAFDKVARLLGLGYPGGPAIDRLSGEGDVEAFAFPRAMPGEPDFSFSGLKTAVANHVRRHGAGPLADLAASFQEAVVDQLVAKLGAAADLAGARALVLGGGVAANSRLRARVDELATRTGRRAFLPHTRCAPTTAPPSRPPRSTAFASTGRPRSTRGSTRAWTCRDSTARLSRLEVLEPGTLPRPRWCRYAPLSTHRC